LSAATFASVLCADWVGLCSDLGADKVNLSTSFQQLRGMSTYPVAEPFAALLEQQVLGSIVAYGVVKGESEDKAVVSPVWTSTPGLSRGVGTSSCRGKSHTYGYLLYSPASFFQSNCLRGAKFIPVTHALPFIEKLRKLFPRDSLLAQIPPPPDPGAN